MVAEGVEMEEVIAEEMEGAVEVEVEVEGEGAEVEAVASQDAHTPRFLRPPLLQQLQLLLPRQAIQAVPYS